MKLNTEIMEREKMRAFMSKPSETLYNRIKICNYESKAAIINVFYNKKREPFAFRIAPAESFSQDELIELFKVLFWRGGEIDDEWYDVYSKWVNQIP